MILADEPISSLDPATSKQIMDLLKEFNQKDGVTVICNLHLPSLAREYGSRIIALSEGRIVYDGPEIDLDENQLNSFYDSQWLFYRDITRLNGTWNMLAYYIN